MFVLVCFFFNECYKRSSILHVFRTEPYVHSATRDNKVFSPKLRTLGTQTDYRDGEAQTDPYSPEYVVPSGSVPELLTLATLTWGELWNRRLFGRRFSFFQGQVSSLLPALAALHCLPLGHIILSISKTGMLFSYLIALFWGISQRVLRSFNIKRSYVLQIQTRSSFSIYLLLFSCSELDISEKSARTLLPQNIPVILISQHHTHNSDGHWTCQRKCSFSESDVLEKFFLLCSLQ